MNFDEVKENIQPLATGRNASILQASLQMDPKQLLLERKELEKDIHNYAGNDPLEPWINYIDWIEQSYPSGGKESGFQEVLEKCLLHFESNERYFQDRRMVKLYIKLIQNRKDAEECYQQLFNAGIGTMVADFYIAWAYCYELIGNVVRADEVFRRGIDCRAEPLEELKEAHQHFGFIVAQRLMYKDNEAVKEETIQQLNDRRFALASLKSHSRKRLVGSIRTGAAIKKTTPGAIQINAAASTSKMNASVKVYTNENENNHLAAGNASQLEDNKSVVRSIVDSNRDQENIKEPATWHKALNCKKAKKLFGKNVPQCSYEIFAEDDIIVPAEQLKFDKPFKWPPNFVGKNNPQDIWITPVTTEEAPEKNTITECQKYILYPRPNKEFQLEEYKGYKWMKRHNMENNFTKERDAYWTNGPHANCRLYPNFAKKSLPQQPDQLDDFFAPLKIDGLIIDYNEIYNIEEKVEYQLEEVLAFKRVDANKTNVHVIDMEETVCEPAKTRRKSFYPVRKSFIPKVKMHSPPNKIHTDPPVTQLAAINIEVHKDVIVEEEEEEAAASSAQNHLLDSATASSSSKNDFQFKAPALPSKGEVKNFDVPVSVLPFEIFQDPINKTISAPAAQPIGYFEADETCSTQAFFMKCPLASTPLAATKSKPERMFGNVLKEVKLPSHAQETDKENRDQLLTEAAAILAPTNPVNNSPEGVSPQNAFPGQLSTILETSEHYTTPSPHNTETTTKSTINSHQDGSDNDSGNAVQTVLTMQKSAAVNVNEIVTEVKELQITSRNISSNQQVCTTSASARLKADLSQISMEHSLHGGSNTVKPVGNFSRLQEKEDTATDLVLKTHFPEEKTETITTKSIFTLQQDQTDTVPNRIKIPSPQLAGNVFQSFNLSTNELPMPSAQLDNSKSITQALLQFSRSSDKTERKHDDLFDVFTQSPPSSNKWALKGKQTQMDLFCEKDFEPCNFKDEYILPDTCMRDLSYVKEPCGIMMTSRNTSIKPSNNNKSLKCDDMSITLEVGKQQKSEESTPQLTGIKKRQSKLSFLMSSTTNHPDTKQEIKTYKESAAIYIDSSPTFNDLKKTDIEKKPIAKIISSPSSSCVCPDDIVDGDDDMSIFYKNSPKTPLGSKHQWNVEYVSDSDEYTHPICPVEDQHFDRLPLDEYINPFKINLIHGFLEKINFTKYIQNLPNCHLKAKIPQLRARDIIAVNDTKFEIMKLVAEGSYGSVFSGKNLSNGRIVALKQERPPNNWEYYICLEIKDRLRIEEMLPAFMNVDYALIANNASILVSHYSPYGSIITVCNKIKKCTMKSIDEYVVMLMAYELLEIIDHLHSINIIHADIKADNFLLMNKLQYPPTQRSIQLIDFGVSIDMKLFDPQQTFTYVHKDKMIRCVEMRQQRPWTYQLDLYGLAGVIHVLLFSKYMDVKQSTFGKWMHTTHVPRYFNGALWETVFCKLLNIRDCHSMPNLQELRALLKQEIEEKKKFVLQHVADFNVTLISK